MDRLLTESMYFTRLECNCWPIGINGNAGDYLLQIPGSQECRCNNCNIVLSRCWFVEAKILLLSGGVFERQYGLFLKRNE